VPLRFHHRSFAAIRHGGVTVAIWRKPIRSIKICGWAESISRWLGAKLLISSTRNNKARFWRIRGAGGGGAIGALAVTAYLVIAASPTPAAAAYWYGGWPGGSHKHKSGHKAHEPKAEAASKDPFGNVPKGPQQIFISINQQKLHLYSNGVHVADTSIATGVAEHPTPLGVFSIIQKQIFHRSNIYSNAPMPFMQRITWSGVAMHEGQNIGHPASHGCIRMPHDFAVRLYRLTKLNARVVIARAELRPVEFADPHLFEHKEKPPEVAMPAVNGIEPVIAKPAELAVHANTLTPVQSDVVTPQTAAPAAQPDQKTEGTVPPLQSGTPAATAAAPRTDPAPAAEADATASAQPGDLAKLAAAKKMPISIFVSRKKQRLYIRQDFEPLFDVPVTIAQPEAALGTHIFTALEFTGPERTTLRWNVVSLPGEPPKRVRHVEERRDRYGRVRRREVEEERAGDAAPPQSPAQVLARIEITPEVSEAIAQMIVPGSALIVSDQGLGDETGEGTDFDVVTR
jgi:L,D-transpeptidase-like protein